MELPNRIIQRFVSVTYKQGIDIVYGLTEPLSLYSGTTNINRVSISMRNAESIGWVLHPIPILLSDANLYKAKVLCVDIFDVEL